jgi:F0F1-type ATP synthase membrane subunit b/b'
MTDDFMNKAAAQARELQEKLAEAMSKGHEQAKPYVDQAMKHADELRDTLIDHAKRSADITHEQTNKALDQLNEAMKSGGEAMRAHAEAARPFMDDFFAKAREAASQVRKTFEK